MSMREYAYEDYGLVLDKATMEHIYVKKFNEPIGDEDVIDALWDSEFCTLAPEFTGEAFRIEDDGKDGWYDTLVYACDAVYYVPFDKYPSLFDAPYSNIDEIIEEFKTKIGEYMPDGYDYRTNLRHIVGTTFG